jgi:hypothetical protein
MADRNSLTAARVRELFHYDSELGWFMRLVDVGPRSDHKLGAVPGRLDEHGYVTMIIDGIKCAAHRVAWLYTEGRWPDEEVDHHNTLKSDNSRENLREADDTIQAQNRIRARKDSRSGVQGVRPHGKRFRAQIRYGGRVIHLGVFDTPREAGERYAAEKRRLHPGCTL